MSSTESTRITLRSEPDGDEALAGIYADVTSTAGVVPHLYQALGAAPPLLQGWIDFAWALRGDARSPRELRELMILRAAQIAGSDYVWRSHRRLAVREGATDAQVEALLDWSSHPELFGDDERAALALTDELVTGPRVSDATWARAAAHFDEGMLVELVLTVSWYQHVARVVEALEVPLEGYHARVAPLPSGEST